MFRLSIWHMYLCCYLVYHSWERYNNAHRVFFYLRWKVSSFELTSLKNSRRDILLKWSIAYWLVSGDYIGKTSLTNLQMKEISLLKDFYSKCHQIYSFLWIWSYLPKKSLMENFIFCAVFSKHYIQVGLQKVSRVRSPHSKNNCSRGVQHASVKHRRVVNCDA